MKTIEMPEFPPNSNPYRYDLFSMGTPVGRNFMIMHGSHNPKDRLIVVHIPSGKRFSLDFTEEMNMSLNRKEDD